MAARSFDYSDYHRTVIAFHGTTADNADHLVAGQPFAESDRDDDWFGKGIYFWEYAPKQAWWWAKTYKQYANPAVVGAVIRLGNCLDLLDPGNVVVLQELQQEMVGLFRSRNEPLPSNVRQKRLDCAVFNYVYKKSDAEKPIDTARAVYVPLTATTRVWKGSWIHETAHIQICVRNPRNILAVWYVREDGRYGKEGPSRAE